MLMILHYVDNKLTGLMYHAYVDVPQTFVSKLKVSFQAMKKKHCIILRVCKMMKGDLSD